MALDLGPFLLALYALAPGTPSRAFCDAALDLLRGVVPFDTALWGGFTRTAEGPQPHWGHIHRLPPQMMIDYERVKQHDVLNQQLIGAPGRTVAISLAEAERLAHPDIIAHARRWGMEHTLATVVLESPLNLYTIVALYRADRARPYSEDERRFHESVMPHLVAAWHMNALRLLAPGPRPGAPQARALVDSRGVLHHAEPGLAELLRGEFASWEGPTLPPELVRVASGERRTFLGRAIAVQRADVLGDDTVVLVVRPRDRVDSLSPRERAVATQFAAGKTHREIALALGTSPATVRSQLQAVYAKLGVGTKLELARRLDGTG